jgi:hypothetical protein
MTKKELQKAIERKITKLQKLLDHLDEVRNINGDEPET